MIRSLCYGIKNDPIWGDKFEKVSVTQEALRNKLLIHGLNHLNVMNNSGPQWVAQQRIAMIEQPAWLTDEHEQKKLKSLDFT